MKEAFLNHTLAFITKNQQDIDEEKKEKLAYGLEGLYLTITKLVVIITIALLLGIWKEFFLSLILFNILRFPGFGFHANNSLTCLISSSILMIGVPYLLTNISIDKSVQGILSIICVICFLKYAPADTAKRPLTNKRKRIIRKICASSLAILYTVVILVGKNELLSCLFLSGLLIETILILPITYHFYGATYRNYLMV